MRYPPEHKAETIEKIVKHAGAVAKKEGFGTTGIDSLMKAAGLTTGAFYKHFDGKEALLTALVKHEIERTEALFFPTPGQGMATLQDIAQRYLSTNHVAHPDKGCMLPALSAEVARAGEETREAFDQGLQRLQRQIAEITNDEQAWVALSTAVGAVLLARAAASRKTQKALLSACGKYLIDMKKSDQ